jgi:hypothetical protein
MNTDKYTPRESLTLIFNTIPYTCPGQRGFDYRLVQGQAKQCISCYATRLAPASRVRVSYRSGISGPGDESFFYFLWHPK